MRSGLLTIAENLCHGSIECAQFIIEHLEESDLAENFNIFLEKIDPPNANSMAGLDIFLRDSAPVDSVITPDDFYPEATLYSAFYGTLSRLWGFNIPFRRLTVEMSKPRPLWSFCHVKSRVANLRSCSRFVTTSSYTYCRNFSSSKLHWC